MTKEDFVRHVYSSSYISKIEKKVKLLGKDSNIDVFNIIITRLLTSIILFILILVTFKYGYILAPVITLLYYNLFNIAVLDDKIKKREIKLEKEAMHFFEVLTLSLETGRNLMEAIEVTLSNVSGLLSKEFGEAIREVKFGKSLTEALNDMQKRIPSDNINNIILSLNESNINGSSIINNLYSQIDFLREKRKAVVKGKISKIPILISIISVLFFIPLLLLLILGPIILGYLG